MIRDEARVTPYAADGLYRIDDAVEASMRSDHAITVGPPTAAPGRGEQPIKDAYQGRLPAAGPREKGPCSADRSRAAAAGPCMLRAFVLVQTEVDRTADVVKTLAGMDGVACVSAVTGPYDVIALVHAADVDELGRVVVAKVQATEGITRTLTCPVVQL